MYFINNIDNQLDAIVTIYQ